MRKLVLAGTVAGLALMAASAADAASLAIVDTDTPFIIAAGVSITGGKSGYIDTDFNALPVGVTLIFEYVGFSAANTNTADLVANGNPLGNLFKNKGAGASAVGDTKTVVTTGNPIEISFTTSGSLGTVQTGSVNIFVEQLAPNKLFIGFEDVALASSDKDYNDLTFTITAVPVPAAIPLFLSGLVGIGLISRRRAHA